MSTSPAATGHVSQSHTSSSEDGGSETNVGRVEGSGGSSSGLSSEVQSIMDSVVSASSVRSYTNGIVNFFMWVFEDRTINHTLFTDWFLQSLTDANVKDLALPTPKKRKAKKKLRAAIKTALTSIVCDDKNTHPFLFDSFNFHIFSCYLTS